MIILTYTLTTTLTTKIGHTHPPTIIDDIRMKRQNENVEVSG